MVYKIIQFMLTNAQTATDTMARHKTCIHVQQQLITIIFVLLT